MAVPKHQIAIIKGMLAYRSADGRAFRQQQISGLYGINSARISEIRYQKKGMGKGIEPAPTSEFPKECWDWDLIIPKKDNWRQEKRNRNNRLRRNGAVHIDEIEKRIRPIAKFFRAEGSKNIATVSFSAIMRHAGLLELCLDEWKKAAQPPKGDRK